jgi:hypothetical protein
MEPTIDYQDFKDQWLTEIIEGTPSSVEKGHRFARKLLGDWLDFNSEAEDIILCDGSGDGGIDAAFLMMGEIDEEGISDGNTWYLVQSKHGTAFSGNQTIVLEGQKLIETLRGNRENLSSLVQGLAARLRNFIRDAGPNDRVKLVYATHDPLDEASKRGMEDVQVLGRTHLGSLFDTDAISIQTIYQRFMELSASSQRTVCSLNGNLVKSGPDLWIGSVNLINMFSFLKTYKRATGDLDQLYEKNVRKFLGGGRQVNKGIGETLRKNPENFGLYNNGITIVAENVEEEEEGFKLTEPYVVNGCQTTKTIWQVLTEKLETGASQLSSETKSWKDKAESGVVVVKLVVVGQGGESKLSNITRFTNSQNSVSRQDFIALEDNFRTLASQVKEKYNLYLEIHRGGWDSQKLLARQQIKANHYSGHVNAFDMLKIYGAAWLGEPGQAFGRNPPFAPGGSIFKKIKESNQFGPEEVFACNLLQKEANKAKFGRNAEKSSRGQTRYLFYFVLVDLVKDILIHAGRSHSLPDVTKAIVELFSDDAQEIGNSLSELALYVIDNYMADGNPDSVFSEPEYLRTRDLNNFLKLEKLGKGRENTPKLDQQLYGTRFLMGQRQGGSSSIREKALAVLDKKALV